MISIQALTKEYGPQKAIDALSFDVARGEILGFLGPNGAGKTTTMKIITCFMPPTSGTVTMDDFNIFEHQQEIRKRVGYLAEHNPLYLDMYVQEFLQFVGRIYQLDKTRLKSRISDVIEMTGLGREQHKKIGALSKGYRQRVGLSQALIHDPELLILDEPTTGLDPNQIVEIRELIKTVGENKTVIFSSHILSEVEAMAERVVIIDQGHIVADSPVERLRHHVEDETIIQVEFAKEGFDFASLEAEEGYRSFEAKSSTQFELRCAPDMDLRQQLFVTCVAQDNIILSLNKETFTLEDAFRKLTS